MESHSEIERRFIVLESDLTGSNLPLIKIRQGYFVQQRGLRVRLYCYSDGATRAEYTRKIGHGIHRFEENTPLDVDLAKLLLDSTPLRITKSRAHLGDWEIDFFDDELTGLVIAEIELTSPDQPVTLPPEIRQAVEVTDSLSNHQLAQIAYGLRMTTQQEVINAGLPRQLPSYEIVDLVMQQIKGAPNQHNLGSILQHHGLCSRVLSGIKKID